MLNFFQSFINPRDHEEGASAVEYGLLVAGIAALIVAVVFVFGGVIKSAFNKTCGKISGGASAASTATCSA